jgi:hypothetical protein
VGNRNKELFEEKLQGIDSEDERKTIIEIKDVLSYLVKKSRGEIVYGDGLERPAFFAKWTKYGNQTKATIEYDTKNGFDLWFLYEDLDEKRPTLKEKLVKCLEKHFPYKNKENVSIYQTKNPCLPISECIGKVNLLEECLKLLNEGR